MRKWMFLSIVFLCVGVSPLDAQPKDPIPPEFERLFRKFDPTKLRNAIAFPLSATMVGFKINDTEKKEELPPIAVIEKKLVGDERDAKWLFKLGEALEKAKSERANDAYEKSAAAYRKRIAKEPRVAKHYLDLTDPLAALERYDEVAVNARRCVEVDPRNADGWWGLGVCYWREFNRLVYGDVDKVSWSFRADKPPPKIVRPLSDAQKERACLLLKYIQQCHQQWKRFAPDDLNTLTTSVLTEAHWDLFDNYFREGTWDVEKTSLFQGFVSKKKREKMIEQGRQKQDPAAFAMAAMSLWMTFAADAGPDWNPAKLKPEESKALAALLEPIEKLCADKDPATAARARTIRAAMAMMEADPVKLKRYAESALEAAPCDKAAIALLMRAHKVDKRADFDAYWLAHVRKHPSTHVWMPLALFQFRNKKLDEVERSLREAEKLDPKNRVVQLARAALALKRGEASLAEAGQILDDLDLRLDEPEEKGGFVTVTDFPSIADAHRYLRAVHKSLSGKWEQGRDELMELRDKEVLVEEIGQALEAFPVRPIILPIQRLELPVPGKK